jgi:hypothetical protein
LLQNGLLRPSFIPHRARWGGKQPRVMLRGPPRSPRWAGSAWRRDGSDAVSSPGRRYQWPTSGRAGIRARRGRSNASSPALRIDAVRQRRPVPPLPGRGDGTVSRCLQGRGYPRPCRTAPQALSPVTNLSPAPAPIAHRPSPPAGIFFP